MDILCAKEQYENMIHLCKWNYTSKIDGYNVRYAIKQEALIDKEN